jgi:hypothetical protein
MAISITHNYEKQSRVEMTPVTCCNVVTNQKPGDDTQSTLIIQGSNIFTPTQRERQKFTGPVWYILVTTVGCADHHRTNSKMSVFLQIRFFTNNWASG